MPVMPPRPQKAAMTPDKLRAMMRRAGVTSQRELAKVLGVHHMTVYRWMAGRTPISAAPAALIREHLGKS